jgi:hypothetical protein
MLMRVPHLGRLGTSAGYRMTPSQLYALFQSAGFPPSVATQMTAVALKESEGDPGQTNMTGRDNSYGLTQINMYGSLGPARMQQCGLTSASQLLDPVTNARCAFRIYGGSDANLDTAWGIDTWDASNYEAKLPIAEAVSGIDVSGATDAPSTPPVMTDTYTPSSTSDLLAGTDSTLTDALGSGAEDTGDGSLTAASTIGGIDSTTLLIGAAVAGILALVYFSRR